MPPDMAAQQQQQRQSAEVIIQQDELVVQHMQQQQQLQQHQQMHMQQLQQQQMQQQQEQEPGYATPLGMVELSHQPRMLTHHPQQIVQTYDHPLYPSELAALPPTGAELQHGSGYVNVIVPASYPSPSGTIVAVHHPTSHIAPSEVPPPPNVPNIHHINPQ